MIGEEKYSIDDTRLPRRKFPLAGKLAILIVILASVGMGAYQLLVRTGLIAYTDVMPPYPVTPPATVPVGTSTPVPTPITCNPQVASFKASNICGYQDFRSYSYQCSYGSSYGLGDGRTSCISLDEAMGQARIACGTSCIAPSLPPTPIPTPVPSSLPTPLPSAIASATPVPTPRNPYSCNIRIFKLKPTDPTGLPSQFVSPDREVNPATTVVAPGERYALLVQVSDTSGITKDAKLSVVTSNLHGFDEPFTIDAVSNYCATPSSGNKFMQCSSYPLYSKGNQTSLTDLGMVVTIQPSIYTYANTSTTFGVGWTIPTTATTTQYWQSYCTEEMLAARPTPTPLPSIPPGCSYRTKGFCLFGLGDCSTTLVCPTPVPVPSMAPSPVPTSTPVASPIASCVPRPACLDANPRCLMPVTPDMCPPSSPIPVPSPIPPNCYYKQVACIQAPCNPILVCSSPVPSSTPVSVVTGTPVAATSKATPGVITFVSKWVTTTVCTARCVINTTSGYSSCSKSCSTGN